MFESITENKPYPPYASVILRGEELNPEQITEMLGINPTKSAKQGDKRGRGNKWPHGLWILESSGQVESTDPIMHIKWLLEQIEPAKKNLIKISQNDAIDVEISCFWIMPSSHEALSMTSELLTRLAALNIKFELSIYSPK